ncbi:MAG: hypothetical protein MZV70_59745 [Desulfobacterales bacterium]|nr:hypothetical protein [Desulfobacterales bacterium]
MRAPSHPRAGADSERSRGMDIPGPGAASRDRQRSGWRERCPRSRSHSRL